MAWQNRFTWFADWVGDSESEFLHRRDEFVQRLENGHLAIFNPQSKKKWDAGKFEVCSLLELREAIDLTAEKPKKPLEGSYPNFEIVVRTTEEALPHVDVAYLQSKAKPNTISGLISPS